MEDDMYGIQFSSLCFINDHVGFQGTIKASPSDFIVIEIDEQGQLVNKAIDTSVNKISKTQPESNNFAKKPKLNLQNESLEHGSNQEVNTLTGYSDGDEDHQSGSEKEDPVSGVISKCEEEKVDLLTSLLDEKINKSLTQFACNIKEMWNSKMELIEPCLEFSLGRILDKNQRAILHSAVRQKFPFLITVGKNSEIIVKPNLEYKELCHLVSEEEALNFFKYLDAKKVNSKFTFKPDADKDHRKAVHHFLNKKFGNLVETKTFPEQNHDAGNPSLVITVRFRGKAHKRGKRSLLDGREGEVLYTGFKESTVFQNRVSASVWVRDLHTASGDVLTRQRVTATQQTCENRFLSPVPVSDSWKAFTLQKENLEMFEAVGFLAIKLGVILSDFSYAGLKDKKAITYQAMVVRKVTPERLKNIQKEIEKKRMNVFNIRSVGDSLRLGQLKGNHFKIVIRNLKNQINDTGSLKERILEAIENVKAKGFVNYYGPQRFGKGRKIQTDQIGLALLKREMVKAIKLFLTPEDADDPVNKAKKYFLQTEDARGTLSQMPEFRVRERALLESLHRFGVTEEGCTQAWFSFPHSMRIFYIHAYSSRVWNEVASYRLATYGTSVVEGDLVCLDEDVDEHFPSSKVHLVTKEDESTNTYAIRQVVLPVLGYNVQYPKNKVAQWYHEVLSRDGLQTCRFRVPALKLNIPGCYRHVLKHPHHLSYQLVDPDSDTKGEAPHTDTAASSLLISFDLDASCYATVCLREMMKHDV